MWCARDKCCKPASYLLRVILQWLFFPSIEKPLKSQRTIKGFLPKVEQILWLFKCCPFEEGRNTARTACGSRSMWGNKQHKFSQQPLTCCTESAPCKQGMMITTQTWHQAKSTACLKISFTALFGSVETRKEMVTWIFLHCIVYRIHREIFGLIIG